MAPNTETQARETGDTARWLIVVAWGAGLYVLSLVAPAADVSLGILGTMELSGVTAAIWAMASWGDSMFWGLSGTTNLLMLWNLRMFRRKWRHPSLRMGQALLLAATFNIGWLYEPVSTVPIPEIRVGYYVCLVSYVVVGVGHLLGSREAGDMSDEDRT